MFSVALLSPPGGLIDATRGLCSVAPRGGGRIVNKWLKNAVAMSVIGLLIAAGSWVGSADAAPPGGEWVFDKIMYNPDGDDSDLWEVELSPTSLSALKLHPGNLTIDTDDVEIAWNVSWDAMPERLDAGETFTRRITIAGQGSGPGTILASYTSIWPGKDVSIGLNCLRPESGGDPECATYELGFDDPTYEYSSGQASAEVSITAEPSPGVDGETFEFGTAALNCSSECVTVWRYRWEDAGAGGAEPSPASESAGSSRSDCLVAGSVRVGEFPLRTFSVRMEAGEVSATIGTDENGNFDFGFIDDYGPAGVAADTFQLFFEAEDFTPTVGRVRIYWEGIDAVLTTTPTDIDGGDCRIDLQLDSVPEDGFAESGIPREAWNEIGLAFRDLADSLKLSDDAGFTLDAVRPLPVLLNCSLFEPSPAPGETTAPEKVASDCPVKVSNLAFYRPGSHIAVKPNADDIDVFGDVMLHEFGHALMYDTYDSGIPWFPGSTNHGGYWVNSTSSDGMVEGFAHFWAVLVKREVRQDPDWWSFKFPDGSKFDLESNKRAWASGLGEEQAYAGVLVDLLDGDRPSVSDDDIVAEVRFPLEVEGESEWCGVVQNRGDRPAANVSVLVSNASSEEEWARFLAVKDGDEFDRSRSYIPASGEASWCAQVEGERSEISVRVVDDGLLDDDNAQLTSATALLQTLTAITSTDGSINPKTVTDVHDGLVTALVGTDGITRDAIDDIFVSHGLFADMSSRQTIEGFDGVEAGEVIGRTDHFAPSEGSTFGEMTPRPSSEIGGYYWARVESDLPDDVFVTVQIIPDLPTTRGATYSVRPNADGDFLIDAPPDDPGAIVRVYATNPQLETPAWVEIDEFTSEEWHEAPVQPTGAPMRTYQPDVSSLATDSGSDGVTNGLSDDGSGGGLGLLQIVMIGLGIVGAAVVLGQLGRQDSSDDDGEEENQPPEAPRPDDGGPLAAQLVFAGESATAATAAGSVGPSVETRPNAVEVSAVELDVSNVSQACRELGARRIELESSMSDVEQQLADFRRQSVQLQGDIAKVSKLRQQVRETDGSNTPPSSGGTVLDSSSAPGQAGSAPKSSGADSESTALQSRLDVLNSKLDQRAVDLKKVETGIRETSERLRDDIDAWNSEWETCGCTGDLIGTSRLSQRPANDNMESEGQT